MSQLPESQVPDKQIGGKLIGQGTFGCVLSPALKCKDKSIVKRKNKIVNTNVNQSLSEHHVGKITTLQSAKLEYRVSRELATIPGASEYFILVDNLCEPAPRAEQTDKELESCKILKDTQLPLFTQITMPLGGKPLVSIPIQSKYLDFIRLIQHLLEAGTLLLIKGIVHYDLHSANILMESKSKAKLIDFGVSWKPNELQTNTIPSLFTYFDAKVATESPEVAVISAMIHNMTVEQAIEAVMKDKQALRVYGVLTNKSSDKVRRILEKFIETSWCFEHTHWLKFFQLYWSKMDAWSIGVIIMDLYVRFIMDSEFVNSEAYMKNKNMILDVIHNICTPDPGKRYDCARALSIWAPDSPILQRIDVQEWLNNEMVIRKELEPILAGLS